MSIVLFGPPGAGKGTQSGYLIEKLGMVQISTGDIFRANIKSETALGLLAKSFMNKGELVPDDVTIKMVREFLVKEGKKSFIFDGFPRTISQGEALNSLVSELGVKITKAIFLEVPRTELLSRLSGRRTCTTCGSVFHVAFKRPQTADICDSCGGKLIQREDDKESVIENRLKAYDQSTFPLKDFYRKAGLFVEVSGLGTAEEVFDRLKQQLT